jgi:hypothetical protein
MLSSEVCRRLHSSKASEAAAALSAAVTASDCSVKLIESHRLMHCGGNAQPSPNGCVGLGVETRRRLHRCRWRDEVNKRCVAEGNGGGREDIGTCCSLQASFEPKPPGARRLAAATTNDRDDCMPPSLHAGQSLCGRVRPCRSTRTITNTQ